MNEEKKVTTEAQTREDIFKMIYGESRMSGVLKVFRKEYKSVKNVSLVKVNKLFGRFSYAIYFQYSPSAIRNNLVKFKKVIEEEGGKFQAHALEQFTISEIYVPIKRGDVKRKKVLKVQLQEERSETQNELSKQIVIKKIIELKDILDNKRYTISANQTESSVRSHYLLAMLGLATGRRFAEIMLSLKIEKRIDDYSFTGLLKKNHEKIEAHIIELSTEETIKYLRELRRIVKTKDMTVAGVNAKYAKTFNNALKRLGFQNVKSLRYNYTIAGSQIFKKKGESVEDTITRILGHIEAFSSALSYT